MLSGNASEAVSEEDWLHPDVDRDNNIRLVKLHRQLTVFDLINAHFPITAQYDNV